MTSKEIQDELKVLYEKKDSLRFMMHGSSRGATRKRVGKLQRMYSDNLTRINLLKCEKMRLRLV